MANGLVDHGTRKREERRTIIARRVEDEGILRGGWTLITSFPGSRDPLEGSK